MCQGIEYSLEKLMSNNIIPTALNVKKYVQYSCTLFYAACYTNAEIHSVDPANMIAPKNH